MDDIIDTVHIAARNQGLTGAKLRSYTPAQVVELAGANWPKYDPGAVNPDAFCVRNQAAARLESEESAARDVIRTEVNALIDAGATKAVDAKTGIISLTPKAEVKP